MVTWERRGGYEVSTKGDKRFSAFNAVLTDGRSIEEHYQCDVKGYDPGGRQQRLGKGKPALDPSKDLWAEYLALWRQWVALNPQLFEGLCAHIGPDGVLSDRFANTCVNQARALAVLANEHFA